jgi:hypothetical protein
VTFEYDSFSRNGLPVNPVVYRIRTDMEWSYHNRLNGMPSGESRRAKKMRRGGDREGEKVPNKATFEYNSFSYWPAC